ncbi:MAG: PKD domain-containing protein [Bacteroidota bacterium]|nr:PKD domain-containing protein [Bacteroidota bacterium]
MKNTGKYKSIEELYRAELGKREYPVSDNFWPRFAKKLRFREFMHFRPGSFNIYYLAGLIAAAAVTISVLTIKSEEPPVEAPDTGIYTDSLYIAPGNITDEKDNVEETGITYEEETEGKDEIGSKTARHIREKVNKKQQQDNTDTEKIEKPGSDKPERLMVDETVISEPVVAPAPVAKFIPDVKEGCVPLSIAFKNLSHNFDSCIWEFGDGGISTEESPVWVYDEVGDYEANLIVFGEDGSRVTATETINVYPKAVARFEVSTGNPAIPDEEIRFYNYSQNSVAWKWDFGDGNSSKEFEPSHFYDKPGSYTVKLVVLSENGCTDTMVITDAFGGNTCFIKFPNAFVPNEGGPTGGYYSNRSDQQEEVFHPVCSGVTSYNLRIYSRRGLLVFETNDIEIGWDGYYKGQKAEPGVYIWKARGMFQNGESFVKGGDVTLLPKW